MPTVQELQKLDAQFHLHPFTNHTQMHEKGTHIITGAEGCYLFDQNNRKLFDGLAGLWCVNVGYNRPEIAEAVYEQMKQLSYYCSFFNTTTEPAILLAEKIGKLVPKGLGHAMFCSSGSEANEGAMKMIRGYQKLRGKSGKYKLLSRTYSYHGVGIATTSLTGLPSCFAPFDLPLPGFIHVPGPHPYGANSPLDHAAYGDWCIEETRRIIEREGPDTIAAMFVEPVQGAGGVIVPPPGYLKKLRALLKEHDILFVADEVITGFGRIGAWFASELWDLQPDLLTMAKGLTSGYLPLGATLISDHIYDVLNTGGYMATGYTYSSHPVTCAAGLANIAIIEKEHLIERVRDDIGPYFQQKLHSLVGHRAVGEVRGTGFIGAIELIPKTGRASLTPTTLFGVQAAAIAREHGLIVRGIRDLIAISPPLIATRAQVDFIFDVINITLEKLWA